MCKQNPDEMTFIVHQQVAGGWLSQDADSLAPEEVTFTSVSQAQPTAQQLEDIKFAWR
jgi:phosphoribosylaminoimidazolecarboxamide formyltransferase/IMP cyclohydrolase